MARNRTTSTAPAPLLAAVAALLLAGPLSAQSGQADTTIPPDTISTLPLEVKLTGRGNLGGVAVDALGFVYVANFRDALWRIDDDGSARLLTDALYTSSGNTVGPSGDLYQSNFAGNTISRIRRTGEVETVVSQGLNGPVGLVFDGEGNLYVCNCSGGSISRVTPDGEVSEFARDSRLVCPNGITLDDRGDLYVVSFNSPDVVRITPDGEVHDFARVTGAGGNGHIAFARGSFFVTQLRGHAVYRVSRAGEVSLLAGDGTAEVRDGTPEEARFSFPNGIAAGPTGNVLWVNDLVGPYSGGVPTSMALRRIRLVTLSDVLAQALDGVAASDQPDRVRSVFRAYASEKPWDDTRGDAVASAYRFMSTGRVSAGIALFQLNAEANPDDPAAHFHLGESYRFTGQTDLAAARYRRVLELAPEFPQARERLGQVSGG